MCYIDLFKFQVYLAYRNEYDDYIALDKVSRLFKEEDISQQKWLLKQWIKYDSFETKFQLFVEKCGTKRSEIIDWLFIPITSPKNLLYLVSIFLEEYIFTDSLTLKSVLKTSDPLEWICNVWKYAIATDLDALYMIGDQLYEPATSIIHYHTTFKEWPYSLKNVIPANIFNNKKIFTKFFSSDLVETKNNLAVSMQALDIHEINDNLGSWPA